MLTIIQNLFYPTSPNISHISCDPIHARHRRTQTRSDNSVVGDYGTRARALGTCLVILAVSTLYTDNIHAAIQLFAVRKSSHSS